MAGLRSLIREIIKHDQFGYNDHVMLRPEAISELLKMSDAESDPWMEDQEEDIRSNLIGWWQLKDDGDPIRHGWSAEDKLDALLGLALSDRIDGRVINIYTRPGRGKRLDIVYGLGKTIEYQGIPAEITGVLRDVPAHIFAVVPYHVHRR